MSLHFFCMASAEFPQHLRISLRLEFFGLGDGAVPMGKTCLQAVRL